MITAFTGATHLAMDTTAGEKERKSLEPLLILPVMICQRGTGLMSSGSRDLRSFSPAVVSMARCVAPVKAVIINT